MQRCTQHAVATAELPVADRDVGMFARGDAAQVGLQIEVAGHLVDRDGTVRAGQCMAVDAGNVEVGEHAAIFIGLRDQRRGEQDQQQPTYPLHLPPAGAMPCSGNWPIAPRTVSPMPRVLFPTAPSGPLMALPRLLPTMPSLLRPSVPPRACWVTRSTVVPRGEVALPGRPPCRHSPHRSVRPCRSRRHRCPMHWQFRAGVSGRRSAPCQGRHAIGRRAATSRSRTISPGCAFTPWRAPEAEALAATDSRATASVASRPRMGVVPSMPISRGGCGGTTHQPCQPCKAWPPWRQALAGVCCCCAVTAASEKCWDCAVPSAAGQGGRPTVTRALQVPSRTATVPLQPVLS